MAALCYAEFAAMIPVAGSAYSYSYATMGELVGWIIGWDLVLEYAVAAGRGRGGMVGILPVILQGIGIHLPHAITIAPGTVPGAIINLPALLIVLLITYVLYVGISESARLNSIIVGNQAVRGRGRDPRRRVFRQARELESVRAVRMVGDHEGRGRDFFRLHRLRRGLDRGGGSRRSESRPAARHPRVAVRLHRALYPGRRAC